MVQSASRIGGEDRSAGYGAVGVVLGGVCIVSGTVTAHGFKWCWDFR